MDLLRDLIVLGSKQREEVPCDDIAHAIRWRQRYYGRCTQLRKASCVDLAGKKAANETEARLLDKDRQPVSFNRPDYEAKKLAGDFSPCYFIIQPLGTDTNKDLAPLLNDRMLTGQLPSQIEHKEFIESYSKNMTEQPPNIAPSSPMDVLRKNNKI